MFEVKFLEEAKAFLDSLEEKPRDKIVFNLNKAKLKPNADLLKKLDDEIWEFRTLHERNAYRLFAFWDETEKSMIVATHGIIKKTNKTPSKEIKRAKRLKKEYINSRKDENL